jgi:hypothetical protein
MAARRSARVTNFPAPKQREQRRAPRQSSFQVLAGRVELLVCYCGWSPPEHDHDQTKAHLEQILGRIAELRANPNPAAASQLRGLADQAAAIVTERLADLGLARDLRRAILTTVKAMLVAPLAEPPTLPIRLADKREAIRESRAYEATTGPPR